MRGISLWWEEQVCKVNLIIYQNLAKCVRVTGQTQLHILWQPSRWKVCQQVSPPNYLERDVNIYLYRCWLSELLFVDSVKNFSWNNRQNHKIYLSQSAAQSQITILIIQQNTILETIAKPIQQVYPVYHRINHSNNRSKHTSYIM